MHPMVFRILTLNTGLFNQVFTSFGRLPLRLSEVNELRQTLLQQAIGVFVQNRELSCTKGVAAPKSNASQSAH